jgi:hypothetical protein
MSDVSRGFVRGLLVPDFRIGYDVIALSLSSYTQAGPLPGVPEAEDETEMVLEASGTQSASKKLRIRCSKAGQPTPDGGAFVWRDVATSGAEPWRGWDAPHQIADFEIYDYTTTANKWKHPHAITLEDGTIVCVVLKGNRKIVALTRSATSNLWSEAEIHDNGSAYTYGAYPTVLVLPSGRLLCYFWKEDAATSSNQVRMHYSDDSGASWSLGNRAVLASALDNVGATITPKRLRAAYLNGQILLVGWIVDSTLARHDVTYQWASSDLGASFTLVDSWDGAADSSWSAYPSLFVANNQFVFHYLTNDSTTTPGIVPHQRRIANAYQLLSAATDELACLSTSAMKWGSIAAFEFTDGDLSSWVDEDGVFYMAGRDHDNAGGALKECFVLRSIDGGATWRGVGSSNAHWARAAWWAGQDTQSFPDGFTGTAQGGRSVLVHGYNANPETHDNGSLAITYLGGYTTVTLPSLNLFPSPAERVSFLRTWVGFDLPENTGGQFTYVPGGAVVALTSGGVNFTGGVFDSGSYVLTAAPTSTLAQGMLALVDIKVQGGTGVVTLVSSDGVNSYTIRVAVTQTTATLRDMHAGVDLGTVAVDGKGGVQVLLAVGNDGTGAGSPNNGQGAAWVFSKGGFNGPTDRAFVSLGSSTTLQAGATPTNGLQWGMLTGSAASDVTVKIVGYSFGSYTGQQLYAGQGNPGDLQGRNFAPTPLFVNDGTKIAAVDGPAFYGDSWQINTRYEYGIENIFPDIAPSPDRPWRSTSTASDVSIVFEYDGTLNQETPRISPIAGIALLNINFRNFQIDGWDKDLGAWVTIAQASSCDGQDTLPFARQGDAILPTAATTPGAREWFTLHTLAGSYVCLRDGGGVIQAVRKIRTNGEGAFNNSATKTARIFVEGAAAGDPTGAGGATCEVWSRDVVVLSNSTDKFTRLRLFIPAQTTSEGYFRIGAMVFGHVVTFARQYSRGRTINAEPNYNLTTSRSGTRRARRLGAIRRSVELAWTDGVDTTQISRNFPSADFIVGHTGATPTPVGSPSDTPYTVQGVADYLNGATTPVVYLPGFDQPSAGDAAIVIVNRNRMLYSRLVSPVRLESRLGSEWSGKAGELFNVATITLEEEL